MDQRVCLLQDLWKHHSNARVAPEDSSLVGDVCSMVSLSPGTPYNLFNCPSAAGNNTEESVSQRGRPGRSTYGAI